MGVALLVASDHKIGVGNSGVNVQVMRNFVVECLKVIFGSVETSVGFHLICLPNRQFANSLNEANVQVF